MDAEAAPFRFHKARWVVEMTDLRARDLAGLLSGLLLAGEDSLFFHMHRPFLLQPAVEPAWPNDFALWAAQVLGNHPVAERLADVNPLQCATLAEVRAELARILAEHLMGRPRLRAAPPGFEFTFRWALAVVLPTRHAASTVEEFADGVERVEASSIYWHVFHGRRRLGGRGNDFSEWLAGRGCAEVAAQVADLDVFSQSLDESRQRVVAMVREGAGRAQ